MGHPQCRHRVIVLLLLLAAGPAAAQTGVPSSAGPSDSVRSELSRELLGLMNVGKTMVYGIERGLETQRASNPAVPEIFWSTFVERAKSSMPTFVEQVVPIYAGRFSVEELRALIAFYQSPVGRRMAEESVEITAEFMRAGQLWGVELGAEVGRELTERGVIF